MGRGLAIALVVSCTVSAAAAPAPGKKAQQPAPSAPISINIGEEDLGPTTTTQSSRAAADPAVARFAKEVDKEIAAAEAAAKAAETPDAAFPHHVKAIFLKLISDDYVKGQYAWANFPKDMFLKLGQVSSPDELQALVTQLDEFADIFDDLVKTIVASPEKIADGLVRRDYEPPVVIKRLTGVLEASPLPMLRERYEAMAAGARAGKEFATTAQKFWGKWMVQDGNLGLSKSLTQAERDELERSAIAARTAISKAREVK